MNPPPLPDPPPRRRRLLGQPELDMRELTLQTVTPILGGAAKPRTLDEVDVIRVPTIRGHLRFWWRVLEGPRCGSPRELAERESSLWGGACAEQGRRSQVEVSMKVTARAGTDDNSPRMGDPDAYALFPARESNTEATAPRWRPGVQFVLHLRAPAEQMPAVLRALRAWILFGGYGSRTRRGCGSLTVIAGDEERKQWLPSNLSHQELCRILATPPAELFGDVATKALELPQLRGAKLFHSPYPTDAITAWRQALTWLRDFRQQPQPAKEKDPSSRYARGPGTTHVAGRSNWPEPDKVRRFARGGPWSHQPRSEYTAEPAWPRAGFGLPIIFHFQTDKGRTREPDDHELRWSSKGVVLDRLASPLILKALPLANGRFAPIALWLYRAYPSGSVVLTRKGNSIPGSQAPFDRLLAPDDTPLYEPLRGGTNLRDAFFDWLARGRKAGGLK